ncbi:MAG: TfoX/Sxy family protein [Steroidobacteraceae bacterium]
MAVSEQFNTLVLDLLGEVTAVSARRMFGGVGYYAGGLFFALADDEQLYFRVDDSNRGDFTAEGMAAFSPMGPGSKSMSYFALPPRLYDEPEELAQWTRRAIAVARRAPPKTSRSAPRAAPRRRR